MNRLRRVNRMALGEARTHGRAFAVLNIILGIGCLLQTYQGLAGDRSFYNFDGRISWIGIALLCAGGLIGPTFVIGVFRETHNRQQSDVVYSLPMSAGERYASRLMALLYLHILPCIIWALIPAIATSVGNEQLMTFYRLDFLVLTKYLRTEIIFQFFWFYVAGVLFFDAIAVVCAVCCGRRVEIRYFTYITAVCLSAPPLLIPTKLMEQIGGQVTAPSWLFFVWTFSPIAWNTVSVTVFNVTMIVNCLISITVMSLAFLIYRRRDAGMAGRPIVSRVFFEISIAVALVTYYILLTFEMWLVPVIALGAVAYIAVHIVTFRGRLSVLRCIGWIFKFAVTTGAVILLMWAAYATDGFGALHYVPIRNLNGACVTVERGSYWSAHVNTEYEGSINAIAIAGPNPVSSYFKPAWDESSEKARAINDEQIRQVAKVVQKYASQRDKGFSAFWRFFSKNVEMSDGQERDVYCQFRIFYPAADDHLLIQEVRLTPDQAWEMMTELSELDFVHVQ